MSIRSTSDVPASDTGPGKRTPVASLTGRSRPGERIILAVLALCAAVSVVTTVAIVVVLFSEASSFFANVSISEFLTGREWFPFGGLERGRFGVLPLVAGTLLVTAVAMLVAVPLGLGAAIYLSEYAAGRVRRVLKPILEILAGVPTIVLGLFALNYVTPLLRTLFGEGTVPFFNAASAGLVMGVMIIPTVASLSEDALSAVPQGLRESGFGVGATRRQVATRIVLPAALSGVVAAVILGFGRAIGETMIVAVAAGSTPTLTANPFSSIQAMTGYIVQAIGGEAPRGSLTYQSIFAVGALLFIITFGINLLAQRFVRRYRNIY